MQWLLLLAAFGCGLILPLQPGINAHLRSHLESPFMAALISFAVGATVLFLITAVVARPSSSVMANLGQVPWWAWTGGFIGAIFVTASIVLAPRLGATLLVGGVVTGQLIGSLVIDHFGLVGYPVTPASWGRVVGLVLLLAGVVTVQMTTGRS